MPRNLFLSSFFTRVFSLTLALGALAPVGGWAQTVHYNLRAQTRDKITALTGSARQGSFGAPSINDKGNVAYACVLSGPSIGALNTFSIIWRKNGKKPAKVALQGGTPQFFGFNDPRTLNDNFLIDTNDASNVFPVSGSGYMFRIAKDVALNNNNHIGFAGQMIETVETDTANPAPAPPTITTTDQSYAVYGEILPSGSTFTNTGITTYLNYFSGILTNTLSINQTGAVPFSGMFRITPEEFLPGFAFNSPTGGTLVATTASNVIGLPYFTTFDSFTDPIIANKNICFIVANLSETGAQFDGIWQGSNPNLQPVVVIQDTAPGGGTFTAFDGKVGPSPKANFAAFIANVTGNTALTRGVFRSTLNGKSIVTIAAVGDAAPGGIGDFAEFTLASSNNRGQVALLGDVTDTNNKTLSGIWLTDSAGKNLRQMVIEGQTLTVGSKKKTVTKIAFSPVSGLNKKGQIAFTASFTDRTSAVFIAK
ncbi:MAG: hypothetical protein PHC88_04595 [Terrimicrobiaceae bacterium]|nr:hypothetical protein [Terrimicrobiaceae bacterium]